MKNDLLPSASDQRSAVTVGTIGHRPEQLVADFTLPNSTGKDFTLSTHLQTGTEPADAIVLYFTMWCPICLGHSDHMFNTVMPQFQDRGDVVYILVDYVSGSTAVVRATETASGYTGSGFVTLADNDQSLLKQFEATNGTTVVIAGDGTVLLNEDYRTGENLMNILDEHLPL